MKLVLYGDPVAPLAVAASSRYAQEVWNAGADRHGRGMSLPELGQVWRAVQPLMPELRWPFARGPMAICMLELKRVGWSMKDPYTFVDEHGLEYSLIERSPRLVMQDFQAAHHRMLARQVASKSGYQGLEGLRVAPEVMQKVLRSKRLSPLEKGSLRCWLAGGLWTQQRLIQAGYLVDNKRQLCEAEVDTPYHRIFRCLAVEAHRSANASRGLLDKARAIGEGNPLLERGLFAHPAEGLIAAQDDRDYVLQVSRDSNWQDVHSADQLGFRGDIFTDGSFFSPCPEGAGQGWMGGC